MAFVSPIEKAVGRTTADMSGAKVTRDVKVVQNLLRRAMGAAAPEMDEGTRMSVIAGVIERFERACGLPVTGVVSPTSPTLRWLIRMATPVTLDHILPSAVLDFTMTNGTFVRGGGYRIRYSTIDGGPLPSVSGDYRVFLSVGGSGQGLDITGRPANDVMCNENLGELLRRIDRMGAWGEIPLPVMIRTTYKGVIVTESNVRLLTSPVKPLGHQLLPLDPASNMPKMPYQGDSVAHKFWGRMLIEVPGFDRLMMMYSRVLETKNANRGFDCITYVGAVCGADPRVMSDSPTLANALGAMPVSVDAWRRDGKGPKQTLESVILEQASTSDIMEYFNGNPEGYHVMFSAGHIVLVHDRFVYEFGASKGGYACTPVMDWLSNLLQGSRLTVRKLPRKPLRAK